MFCDAYSKWVFADMWLITPVGFFSLVQKPADVAAGTLTVRARVRSDIDSLRVAFLPELTPTKESSSTDYRFRAQAPKEAVSAALAKLAESIDYSNFKDVVAERQGKERAHLYHGVWDVLYAMQGSSKYEKPITLQGKGTQPSASQVPKADAYGGVLIDDAGRILLREPTDHFGGYVWTFAKGRIDKGETPEQAALATAANSLLCAIAVKVGPKKIGREWPAPCGSRRISRPRVALRTRNYGLFPHRSPIASPVASEVQS